MSKLRGNVLRKKVLQKLNIIVHLVILNPGLAGYQPLDILLLWANLLLLLPGLHEKQGTPARGDGGGYVNLGLWQKEAKNRKLSSLQCRHFKSKAVGFWLTPSKPRAD
jgi:hypothetical protein